MKLLTNIPEPPLPYKIKIVNSISCCLVTDGIYTLTINGNEVKTYCDFTANGGGWTLVLTSATRTGWQKATLPERNADHPALDKDFSILRNGGFMLKGRSFQVVYDYL